MLPSAIERITKVDTPQPCVCALHATLSPTVTKFDNNTRWGGEIPMRVMLEKLYCERRRVPRVDTAARDAVEPAQATPGGLRRSSLLW